MLANYTCQNFKALLSLLTCVCRSLTLSTYQNRDEFDSEPWAEKGTGHLINSNLKKIIQTELTIIPPTEVHETRFARDTTSWSPTPRSDS